MGKCCFLTGHKGFVGSHLLPKLIEQGYEVETDMRYLHSKKYEALIHLAAVTHTRPEFDPALIESNYILTKEIFKVNTKILYASSCSARHDTCPYAASKLYAEHLGSIHGNALGFRFHNIYGQRNRKGIVWYLMQQPDGAKITIRGKDLVRDYVHVRNVVTEIIEQIVKDQNPLCGVIDVGTGIGTTTLELVELYMKLSGKNLELEFTKAGEHEPKEMISNRVCAYTSLYSGLLKMINESM